MFVRVHPQASLDVRIPIVIFGTVAIAAALLTLLLPETANKEMLQTIADGEAFGNEDTGFKTLDKMFSIGRCKTKKSGKK